MQRGPRTDAAVHILNFVFSNRPLLRGEVRVAAKFERGAREKCLVSIVHVVPKAADRRGTASSTQTLYIFKIFSDIFSRLTYLLFDLGHFLSVRRFDHVSPVHFSAPRIYTIQAAIEGP